MGRDQCRRDRHAHSERERFALLDRVIDQFDEPRHFDFADRASKGSPQERSQIFTGCRRETLVGTRNGCEQAFMGLGQRTRIEVNRPDELHVAHDQIAIAPILVLRLLVVEWAQVIGNG